MNSIRRVFDYGMNSMVLVVFSPVQPSLGLQFMDGNNYHSGNWPHAPHHRLEGKGVFMVTASTLHKRHLFHSKERLDYLVNELLGNAQQFSWQLEAWAAFSNHYHFVGRALRDASTLEAFLRAMHAKTANYINDRDSQKGRRVWFNYWDTQLTFFNSYLARLNYVHQNPVRHGLVRVANQYPWCSAVLFERSAEISHVRTVYQFKIDKVKVTDDFEPLPVR